jgi:hypothetical protein
MGFLPNTPHDIGKRKNHLEWQPIDPVLRAI